MNPVLLVLVVSGAAAAVAALGVLPLLGRERPPALWLAWANALAAGVMLGSAFALIEPRLHPNAYAISVGAVLGVAFMHSTRAFSQTADLALNRLDEREPDYGYEVLLVASLHSSAEGVAIGAAMGHNVGFGVFVAAALALHNIAEGTLLAAVCRARGVSVSRAGALAVVSNFGLVLMAVATLAVVQAAPAALPWALGFAAGALIYLVMVDLLPDSYSEAGPTSIALAVILALWAFGLLRGALM